MTIHPIGARRIAHGLWRAPEVALDTHARISALLSTLPPMAVVSGITAGRLYGLWLPVAAATAAIETILRRDAADQTGHSGSERLEVRGRRRRLAPDEVTVLDGLPVTTLARTWVDLAELLDMPDLVAAGDCTLRCETTLDELAGAVMTAHGRRGVVRARAALPLLNERSRSRPESHLRYALVSRGLPEPKVNTPLVSDLGEWLAEPDLSYEDARLAIEYNGAMHAATGRMRRDITREIDLGTRGCWRVVTVGPAEVFGRPDQTATYIRQIRHARLYLRNTPWLTGA